MLFLVRFIQKHESFRRAELQALAEIQGSTVRIVHYDEESPFCIVDVSDADTVQKVIGRSILCKAVYELWGRGASYEELHGVVKRDTASSWALYKTVSFRFYVDCFRGSRTMAEQTTIVNSFAYTGFDGPIRMKQAEQEFCVFEEYADHARQPHSIYFGRLVGLSARDAITTYSLKTRHYISTTSMDSELALIGANLALAGPGKLVYDPFMGTGGLPLACSHFGAMAWGSDIDPRTVRGKGAHNIATSFAQYGLSSSYLGSFVGDLTHSPLRTGTGGWLDIIVCDPPYGVREGLQVLGSRKPTAAEPRLRDGKPAHLAEGFIPPRKQYSFDALLRDIMEFAACMLVEHGRLSFWMPTANDEDRELAVPTHPALELVSNCVQVFHQWSRRLLTYRRLPAAATDALDLATQHSVTQQNGKADDLNNFRKRYFEGFK